MEFIVPEMSCGHCTSAIEKAIQAVDPGAKVDCDLASHRVTVASALSSVDLGTVIKNAGYDAQAVAA